MTEPGKALATAADLPLLELIGTEGEGGRQRLRELLAGLLAAGLRPLLIGDRDRGEEGAVLPGCPVLSAPLDDHSVAHDLVLVLGGEHSGAPFFALTGTADHVPEGAERVGAWEPLGGARQAVSVIRDWLRRFWLAVPVWACVLIGGRSSRMGRPKHLLLKERATWLEETVELLTPLVDGLVLSGRGELPRSLTGLNRLADPHGVAGPLAGILSALRWQPRVSWLLLACDMPVISRQALEWLLAGRAPGCWGTLPRLAEDGFVEPLLAHYDFRAAPYFEELAADSCFKIGRVARRPAMATPLVPAQLRRCWLNVNTPEELEQARGLWTPR